MEDPAGPCLIALADGGARTGPVHVDDDVTVTSINAALPSGAAITGRAWTVERMPPGAIVAFTAPDGISTAFVSGGTRGLQVAGGYVLNVALEGAGGESGALRCALQVDAHGALAMELSWPTRNQDLDIHLFQVLDDGGVAPDSPADCSFLNCQPRNPAHPAWGNADAGTTDPLLLLESDQGYGPERIELAAPPPGQYLVSIHHYHDNGAGPTEAGLAIELFGRTLAFWTTRALDVGERLDVARIRVPAAPGQPLCLEDLIRSGSTCVDAPGCGATCPACTAGAACGPGLVCRPSTGLCEPVLAGCTVDTDCAAGRACQGATGSCVEAECTAQQACDLPALCQAATLRCETLPPVCSHDGEPNNDPDQATPIAGAPTHAPLCRGDVDILAFTAPTDARATVHLTVAAPEPRLAAQLTSADGAALLDSAVAQTTEFTLSGFVAAGSRYLVQLALPENAPLDQVDYSAFVAFDALPSCAQEPNEPNDTLDAPAVVTTTALAQSLCSAADQDYFQFTAAAGQRVYVGVDAVETLALELLDPLGTLLASSMSGSGEGLQWATGTAAETLILHVSAPEGTGFPAAYAASIHIQAPAACADAAQEPNNTPSTPFALTAAGASGVACDHTDDDYYAFSLSADADVDLMLAWADTTADLDLVVLQADGTAVEAAASADNPELLVGVPLVAGDYLLRVLPVGTTAPVAYSLALAGLP